MSAIGKYEELVKSGEIIEITPTILDRTEKCLACYDSNEDEALKIIVPLIGIYRTEERVESQLKTNNVAGRIYKTIYVTVDSVNPIKGVVTCTFRGEKDEEKEQKVAEIKKYLEENKLDENYIEEDLSKPNIVRGIVVYIGGEKEQSYAILKTAENVKLLLLVKQWSWGYVRDIRDVLHIGDKAVVCIYRVNDSRHHVDFIVSRKRLQRNPWVGMNEGVHAGDTVVATVNAKWRGGFAAKIDSLYGVNAFVEVYGVKCRIIPGEKYICTVKSVKEDSRRILLHPIKMVLDKNKMIK